MLIYLYSSTKAPGGSHSTFTTLKYLKEYHSIIFIDNLNKLNQEIKKKRKPDLLLHHNLKDLIKVFTISKKNKIPIIITVNNLITCPIGNHIIFDNNFGKPILKYNFLTALYAVLKEKKTRPFNRKLLGLISFPYRHFIKKKKLIKILNEADGVIAIGKTLKYILEINGVKRKIYVCPQPIDDSFLIKPKSLKRSNRILFVGGGEPFKGIDILIKAFLELNKDVELVIAGRLRKEQKIKKNIHKNIRFVGEISQEELKQYYYSSYFLAFPNIWFEPFGRGWAEAITCGCPVLSFKHRGGAADYLTEKEAYFVNENYDEFKRALKEMLENKELRERLSKNALNFAKKELIASVVIKKLNKIYEDVLI